MNNQKKFKIVLIVLLLLSYWVAALPQDLDQILIKIPKEPAQVQMAFQLSDFRMLQELNTCILGLTSSEQFNKLKNQGFAGQILLHGEASKWFLVYIPDAKGLSTLRIHGDAELVETTNAIFKPSGNIHPRQLLPASFKLKVLAPIPLRLDSIHFYKKAPVPAEQSTVSSVTNLVIQQIVNQVSKARLTQTIQDLQDFQTRDASRPECDAAGDYLYNTLKNMGLVVEFQHFPFDVFTAKNVIATLPGKTSPQGIVIICAHYDSTSDISGKAPGADDNGSGTSAVIEAARVLRHYNFDFTIKFCCWSAEEYGLYGSRHYANQAWEREEKIVGVINLDMIGFSNNLPEDLDVVHNGSSAWIAECYKTQADLYTNLPINIRAVPSLTYSDHAPFWDSGYYAILGIEDWPLNTPFYHTQDDKLETMDMALVTDATRVSLAVAAAMAQLEGPVPPPKGIEAQSQVVYSIFLSHKSVFINWQQGDSSIKGYNIYRTTIPHTNYKKLNSSPITGNSFSDMGLDTGSRYFYILTALNQSGEESNFSIEVKEDQNNAKQ